MAESQQNFQNKNVLLVDGYARQSLAMAKALHRLGCIVTVVCFSKLDVGYLTRYARKRILLGCKKDDYARQEQLVCDEIKAGHYDLVIPMTDYSATYLSRRKSELLPFSKVAVNDWDKFQYAIDKALTMQLCAQHGIPAPKTLQGEDLLEQISQTELSYPVVVKPRTACGSMGFHLANDREQLIELISHDDNSHGPLLVQEYIPQNGPQYGAEVFRDKNGKIKSCLIIKIPRWFPLDGGSRILSVSIHDEKIRQACIALVHALDWNGYANIDLLYDARTGEPKLLELNPRTGASIQINFECGVDLARLILENELGGCVTDMSDYPDNKQVSCFLVDLLWFLKCRDRFRATPSWFQRGNIKDIIFSWEDPLPFFGFCLQSAIQYKGAMKKRKRRMLGYL